MKKLFLTLLLVVPGLASATPQTVDMIYDNAAVVRFCKPGLMGCAERVVIGGEAMLVEALAASKASLEAIRGAHHAHGLYETQPGKVSGFIVREKGHFPNPLVEFEVFKLLDADIPLPK